MLIRTQGHDRLPPNLPKQNGFSLKAVREVPLYMKCVSCYSLSQITTQSLTDDFFVVLVSGFNLLAFCPTIELRAEQRSNIRLEEHIVTLETVVLAVYLVPDPKPSPARFYTRSNICTR